MKVLLKRVFLVVLLSSLPMLVQANGISKFNVELSGSSYVVKKIDYHKKIIYTDFNEFSYNARTRFITQAGEVEANAVRQGSQIRFSISQKKLLSLRPILVEVRIRTSK